MTLEQFGNKAVRAIDRATDLIIEILLCVVLLIGVYSLWDSRQVYQAADAANYIAYRPEAEDSVSFDELRRVNPEVFAWLTVNDTPIDYPVTQTDNNEKYINTNAEGQYTLSGSIFLDYRNSPDFDDFNSIFYGHHMEQRMMFGSLSDFADRAFFDDHPYGNLFFNGRDHGLEFFALVLTDAYDSAIFSPAVSGEEARQAYLDMIRASATHWRELSVTTEDQIVLLSTCTSTITNGRYLLVGRLTDELHLQETVVEAPVIRLGAGIDRRVNEMALLPIWVWFVILFVLFAALVTVWLCFGRRRPEKRGKESP